MILFIIAILLFVAYSILIFYYWLSWKAIPVFEPGSKNASTRISVIIAARNEEQNIGQLLQALEQQSYPKQFFEVIVADDHSTDKTAEVVKQYPGVKLLQLEDDEINSYKKKAIETGIGAATGELIVTTDADCIPQKEWLSIMASFYEEKKSSFIAAPVSYNCNSSVLQIFQAMDFMILQGVTGASVYRSVHSMCNGANLAYKRKLFYDVKGFEGIDNFASGDDMLLMHKIWKKNKNNVHYLKSKDAIVSTLPMITWNDFVNQRIRWASKAAKYDDKRIFWVLLLVYLLNLSFLALLVTGFFDYRYWILFLFFWLLKTLAELPFFLSLSKFFNKQWTVKYFFFFQPLHILYTLVAGWLGQFVKYEWKGRNVR